MKPTLPIHPDDRIVCAAAGALGDESRNEKAWTAFHALNRARASAQRAGNE